jgi:hypothetical protein
MWGYFYSIFPLLKYAGFSAQWQRAADAGYFGADQEL